MKFFFYRLLMFIYASYLEKIYNLLYNNIAFTNRKRFNAENHKKERTSYKKMYVDLQCKLIKTIYL